jgi:hypothetical protein
MNVNEISTDRNRTSCANKHEQHNRTWSSAAASNCVDLCPESRIARGHHETCNIIVPRPHFKGSKIVHSKVPDYLDGTEGRSDNRKCRIILKTREKDEGKYQLNL